MREAKKAKKAADQELVDRARRPDQSRDLRDQAAELGQELESTVDDFDRAAEALRQEVGIGPEADLFTVARKTIPQPRLASRLLRKPSRVLPSTGPKVLAKSSEDARIKLVAGVEELSR